MSQKVTIVSEKAPQSGQDHRSSNNFSLVDFREDQRLTFKAYYDYGMATQTEAKDVIYDVWADRTGKDDDTYNNVTWAQVLENTHHRNLYIANPRNAKMSFTVEISV